MMRKQPSNNKTQATVAVSHRQAGADTRSVAGAVVVLAYEDDLSIFALVSFTELLRTQTLYRTVAGRARTQTESDTEGQYL